LGISERNSIFETSTTKSLCYEELKRNFFDCDAMGSDATLWEHRMSSTTPMLLDTLYHSLTYDAQLPGAGVSRLVDLWYGAGNVPAYRNSRIGASAPTCANVCRRCTMLDERFCGEACCPVGLS
jgi:hypothetical protein